MGALSHDIINMAETDLNFSSEINRRSGVNTSLCWHCRSCAGGCPFSQAMDYSPHAVIRLIQLGLKNEAFGNSAIWFCVGCNTCSIQCPNGIDIAAVNDTLCKIAIEEGVAVAEPDILNFHNEVLNSIKRYGRTHKLEIMLRYKAKKRNWFADFGVGLKMLFKRKLHLLPTRSNDILMVRSLFKQNQTG